MANRLNVADIQSIVALHAQGWSCRRIARELAINRETVAAYVHTAQRVETAAVGSGPPACGAGAAEEAAGAGAEIEAGVEESRGAEPGPAAVGRGVAGVGSKPATAPIGSGAAGGPKPATAPIGSGVAGGPKPATAPIGSAVAPGVWGEAEAAATVGQDVLVTSNSTGALPHSASDCRAYQDLILAKLEQGLSAVRIHQDLVGQAGDEAPSYYSVRRFVAGLQREHGLPFRRIECKPGAESQVDFGTGSPIVDAHGHRRRPHVLRVVLSHSRKGFSQVIERQTTEGFIRCLEDAFWYLGGTTVTIVLDNLRAAVQRADWFDPELNPKVQSFFAHYGIAALPTRPGIARHKGKVERGIAYVQDNALKGRVFTSLEEQNRFLLEWEKTVADKRLHGTTRKQVGLYFQEAERAALRPLPLDRFPCFEEGRRTVHRDGHVEVDKAYYSVPPEYLSREVWIRWDSRMVRIFDARMQLVATHIRQEPGRFSTQDRHILDQKIAGVERGAAYLLGKVAAIGLQAQAWGEAMIQARGIEGVRVLQGLLSLAGEHSGRVNRACEIALEHGAWRLRTIRQLLARQGDGDAGQQHFEFIDEHPIIRPLSDYGELVHQSILQPQETSDHE